MRRVFEILYYPFVILLNLLISKISPKTNSYESFTDTPDSFLFIAPGLH